ncbi:hypothetical protein [Halorubrum vacuolatum]|uniref:Uncharacterized protein n=1 Tax=Halorubrum vacuolatum TaxID=63740 RepID=A0A238WVK6_HALVU|nr:hypothetical protein [Halorubrum vacuolatum]SNR50411.1 hypothetical protein SAMN06264855_11089 [Halorubrum vacuolatum]
MNDEYGWSLRTERTVLVVEFARGTVISPKAGSALVDRLRVHFTETEIDGVVMVVHTSRSCSDAGREALRRAVQLGMAHEIDRWALVAERPKRRYLERSVDVDGIEVETFNGTEPATSWIAETMPPTP